MHIGGEHYLLWTVFISLTLDLCSIYVLWILFNILPLSLMLTISMDVMDTNKIFITLRNLPLDLYLIYFVCMFSSFTLIVDA